MLKPKAIVFQSRTHHSHENAIINLIQWQAVTVFSCTVNRLVKLKVQKSICKGSFDNLGKINLRTCYMNCFPGYSYDVLGQTSVITLVR